MALLVGVLARWPMPLDPAGLRVDGFCNDSHVWCLALPRDLTRVPPNTQPLDQLALTAEAPSPVEARTVLKEVGWPLRAAPVGTGGAEGRVGSG